VKPKRPSGLDEAALAIAAIWQQWRRKPQSKKKREIEESG